MPPDTSVAELAAVLASEGFIAAEEDAADLVERARGDEDLLQRLVARRVKGEPIAWITGSALFCGRRVQVLPGVYVPRWQSEPLAERAVSLLPVQGVAVDACTGSGAIATVLRHERPTARVVATETDPRAIECAQLNGVEVFPSDLLAALPSDLGGRVDVIVAVPPYVPIGELRHLPRDTLRFESKRSYDGGLDGADLLRRIVAEAPTYLRPGGSLLLELGADQAELLAKDLASHSFSPPALLVDTEDDVRGIESTFMP